MEADTHKGEFEIHYIVNGQLNWWVEDKSYELHSGNVLIIQPDEVHGSNTGVLEPCEHYWLRITFPKDKALPGLTLEETRQLKQEFYSFQRRLFPASAPVRDAFTKIIEEHRARSDYSELISRASLHTLLASLIRDHKNAILTSEQQPSKILPSIQRCIRDIHDNLKDPFSVAEMAKRANMSETSFRKRFKEEIGCSPLDYINRRRIQEAKQLLNQSRANITEIAYKMGFSSSQYFATVFKRVTGSSPRQFIKDSRRS